MKHISLSAGAIPVRRAGSSWEYLIMRSFNYWDFPKGMVEAHESPLDAALREVEEESGIKKSVFTWGKDFIETLPYGRGKIARYYLIEVEKDAVIKIVANPLTGVVEHHEYLWLSYQEARDKLVPRLQIVIDWAQKKLAGN